jgi:hypothetical protein
MRTLNILRQTVPNLVVSQRVLDKMVAAASHYLEDETGEALIGLVIPGNHTGGVPTLYLLDTISPDDSAVRAMHTFQQGDERQDEIIWWLQENWQVYRQKRRDSFGSALQAKWDVPLRYLGDWHKQPGFMIAPSGADQFTALDWLDDPENGMDFLIAPIVTLGHPATTANIQSGANFLTLPHEGDSYLRVDFWYIDQHLRLFQPITPTVYPEEQLPRLTAYPWHLVNPDRMSTEFNQLQADGLFTSVILWSATDDPPLEICFLTARVGSDQVLIAATQWNYPDSAPAIYRAPFRHMDPNEDMYAVFTEMWAEAVPVEDPPGWIWTPDKYLIDYVHAVETALGLRPADPAPPPVEQPAGETADADSTTAGGEA